VRALPIAYLCGFAALAAAGCGSGSGPATPTIQPARTFQLGGFEPAGDVPAGKPVKLGFVINQPSGAPLTQYRRGAGPHTGIHVILVRSDLASMIHHHPPVAADGRVSDTVTFPEPGRYRLVVDAYPNLPGPLRNFQLFPTIEVGTSAPRRPLPPFRATQTVDGFRIAIANGQPRLRAIEPAALTVLVTDPKGRRAVFKPWFGALAHAIFFHAGNLDYVHTHVCAPGATGCASLFGGTSVSGTSTQPGRLRVGVLLPESGLWRLFLQFQSNGHVLTVPFTLRVR
jgi:hypothetical protein